MWNLIIGKPDLIASGFSENQYSFQSLIQTSEFNGTWTYTQQDSGEDMWVHESGKYQLRLPSYSGAHGYPVWHVFSVGNTNAGEFWENDGDHDSSYSSPTEVKQWNSQLANLTGKFEEKTSSENGSSSGSESSIIYTINGSENSTVNGDYVEMDEPKNGFKAWKNTNSNKMVLAYKLGGRYLITASVEDMNPGDAEYFSNEVEQSDNIDLTTLTWTPSWSSGNITITKK